MTRKIRRRGEGTIRQRPDEVWEARLTMPDGKRKSLYAPTEDALLAKLRQAQRDLEDGVDLSADTMTVAQFLDKWLSAAVKPSVKTKTYITYESLCRTAIAPRIGSKKLAKLSALDLQSLYTNLADAGLSPRSVHHVHRVLHRAFAQAVRWKLLPRNPCDGATSPKAPRVELSVWSAGEADAFLIAARAQRMHGLYVLAL